MRYVVIKKENKKYTILGYYYFNYWNMIQDYPDIVLNEPKGDGIFYQMEV